MGWGRGRFPVISQLNAMTATDGDRQELKTYFHSQYTKANPYALGRLCRDWENSPVWAEDHDNPYHGRHADDWFAHCQALDDKTRADLEGWIVEAIENEQRIVYRFRLDKNSKTWTATRTRRGSAEHPIWRIEVTGPGW